MSQPTILISQIKKILATLLNSVVRKKYRRELSLVVKDKEARLLIECVPNKASLY